MSQQPPTYGSPPAEDDATTGDVARDQGEQVKDEVVHQAQSVAGTVAEEASHVAHEAVGHAKDLAADAKQQLHRQAREQTDNLGGTLDQFGDRVHALAEGRTEDAGNVGDYANRIADQVDALAARVNDLGFDGMVQEMQRFARRRPGAFLACAAVAGFAVSRLGRGVQASQQEQSDSGTSDGSQSSTQGALPAGSPRTGPSPISARPSTGTMPPPPARSSPSGAPLPPTTPSPDAAPPSEDPITVTHDPAVSPAPSSGGQVRR